MKLPWNFEFMNRINIPPAIHLSFILYLIIATTFIIFRLTLWITNASYLTDVSLPFMIKSFFLGLKYDTIIAGYILLPVCFFLIGIMIWEKTQKLFLAIIKYYLIFVFTIVFMLAAIDMPYHNFWRFKLKNSLFLKEYITSFIIFSKGFIL